MKLNIKREVQGELDPIIAKLTEKLGGKGFGILTRIDFHTKMKEKLNENIPPCVILGACNPKLAFQAYQKTSDVAGLIPCNAVVREVGPKKYSVELTLPSAMMEILREKQLAELACEADKSLQEVLESL